MSGEIYRLKECQSMPSEVQKNTEWERQPLSKRLSAYIDPNDAMNIITTKSRSFFDITATLFATNNDILCFVKLYAIVIPEMEISVNHCKN